MFTASCRGVHYHWFPILSKFKLILAIPIPFHGCLHSAFVSTDWGWMTDWLSSQQFSHFPIFLFINYKLYLRSLYQKYQYFKLKIDLRASRPGIRGIDILVLIHTWLVSCFHSSINLNMHSQNVLVIKAYAELKCYYSLHLRLFDLFPQRQKFPELSHLSSIMMGKAEVTGEDKVWWKAFKYSFFFIAALTVGVCCCSTWEFILHVAAVSGLESTCSPQRYK